MFPNPMAFGVVGGLVFARRRGPTLVTPHVCIGSREDARDLDRLKDVGVTHVLNCAKQLASAHPREFIHARLELEGEKVLRL